jgi:hypothetical protein
MLGLLLAFNHDTPATVTRLVEYGLIQRRLLQVENATDYLSSHQTF